MRIALILLLAALAMAEDAWVIGSDGVAYEAAQPEELTRPVTFQTTGQSGLEATFLAQSVGGERNDDWRTGQRIAGTRRDANVDQPRSSFGTPVERRRLGIGGKDKDWDSFAVQWDGTILVPAGGADLATSSDDGSRVWIDLNRDGVCQPDEWGDNGWGEGQGTTRRTVRTAVPGGSWQIRVQYNEYGLANDCRLEWQPTATSAWEVVPASSFVRTPVLTLRGPLTVRSNFTGHGELHCDDGVRLATAPSEGVLGITGHVTLAADLDRGDAPLIITNDAVLDLAGHSLRCTAITGTGTVQLSGGRLSVGQAAGLRVAGQGRLACDTTLTLADLDPAVTVELAPGASVRSPRRSVVTAPLVAPLATVLELAAVPADASRLQIDLSGPLAGAGLMAWRADRHGRWFQRLAAPQLTNGRQRIVVDLSPDAALAPMRQDGAWNAATAGESPRVGLLVYADKPITGTVQADASWLPTAQTRPMPCLAALVPAPDRVHTGTRVEISTRPSPFPALPFDPDCFALDLVVTGPDDTATRYAGFVDQPFSRLDRGDREVLSEAGPARFTVRWRAHQPGLHHLRLEARWDGGTPLSVPLPDVFADGVPWDDIARVDANDPRFLSSQDRMVWPIGHNLHGTYDTRSVEYLSTALTFNRGSFVREAMLARLAAAGGTGTEVWMSPWNLGLEWIDDWAGFHGTGRPNLGNAWALDRLLDQADGLGMRVVLTIFNHGMGRSGDGAEQDWRHHPWNIANGGWLETPEGLFTDPEARKRQEHLFRYLAARWGDSPAVLAWKLWAEVNLTNASRSAVRAWHEQAAAIFARVDPWKHPVTTHWCANWHAADREIAAMPGIGMLTIDAYHGDETLVADLLGESTSDPRRPDRGLASFGKPVLVAEYGGNWSACSDARMQAELAIGGWAALVSGHAGTPLMWWFEWIDQGGHYASFAALRRFIDGEDLRGAEARTVVLDARAGSTALWCRAWNRPGRMLGYLLDRTWGRSGGEGQPLESTVITIGEVAAGPMHLAWWDADQGVEVQAIDIAHPGGVLRLSAPPFRRHLAFKLWREAAATPVSR